MKKLLTLLTTVLITTVLSAQAPQKMSYQTVIRDNGNVLITNSPVGLRVSILQGSPSGTAVYMETHTASSNANGLVSLELGSGSVVLGTIAGIDWSAGPYYVQTETDPAGGTAYAISGISEMLSVPYAMFAASGVTGPQGPQGPMGNVGATGPPGPAGSLQSGTSPGEMFYWDGSVWSFIPPGVSGENLSLCNGVPVWGNCDLPAVFTTHVSEIEAITATGGGIVSSEGGTAVTARGLCWSTSPNPTTADNSTNDGAGAGNYSSNMTGLLIGTTWYVRAYATNGAGTAYGNEVSFTTADLPGLTTIAISAITGIKATSGGNISSNGGAAVTTRGLCWSSSPNPTTADATASDGSGTGSYASNMNELLPLTTYYVRAYATNVAGTAYGNEVSFTTTALQIGDFYQGGVVFYLDVTGQHGLVCAVSDQATHMIWGCFGTPVGATGFAVGTGQANTNAIDNYIPPCGAAYYLCSDLVLNGYNDWFMPSRDELNEMYLNKSAIDTTALANGGGALGSGVFWSSSEVGSDDAWFQNFKTGNQYSTGLKSSNFSLAVRAVRAF